jgi:VWFA-related protein
MLRRSAGVVILGLALSAGFQSKPPVLSAQAALPASVALDVTAVDRDGRTVDDLGPQDFVVSVDGQPRRVLSVRRVSRGPGATSDAASRPASGRAGTFAAEPSRTVLVVIDQTMLRRGDERTAVQAATALLDRLGLDDRVAVVRVPIAANTPVALTTDRPATREALRAVAGQAGLPTEDKAGREDPNRITVEDPDRAKVLDPERNVNPPERPQQIPAPDTAASIPEDDLEKARASLAALADLLRVLQPIPGRKVVAVFSAGLPPVGQSLGTQVDAVAAGAAGARATVHAFGLRFAQIDDRLTPDFSPIEMLARKTGGSFAMLDKDASRTIERMIPQLSACYVLNVETGSLDADGRPHALRVETPRKGLTLRAPSFLVARDDPEDAVIAERALDAQVRVPPDNRDASREADLQLVLSRMIDYVRGYQRAFSGLVAEEDYRQSVGQKTVRLRSDFLLVKLETADYWISFRDVFEVDGKPVRDREERLKRLFLDNPATEAMIQARKIRDESSRHNVGPVERNLNVPLFPLTFLLPENRLRFHFTLGKKGDTNGLPTWRVEYDERIRPTIIANSQTRQDVPARGWFLVDPVTGAVVETGLDALDAEGIGHFVVRYRRDALLGLWLPAEMKESYNSRARATSILDAKATYSNFRRFQVKTEEKITIPK